MYEPSDRSIQQPETILEHLTPYVGPMDMGPTCGPHRGPHRTRQRGSHHMWGPRNQLYVGLTIVFQTKKTLNSDKINPHSTYVAPHKTLWALVKSICTPRTTNPQKTHQDFYRTNPLNVYRWRVKSPHTFTHCIMGYNTAYNRIYQIIPTSGKKNIVTLLSIILNSFNPCSIYCAKKAPKIMTIDPRPLHSN